MFSQKRHPLLFLQCKFKCTFIFLSLFSLILAIGQVWTCSPTQNTQNAAVTTTTDTTIVPTTTTSTTTTTTTTTTSTTTTTTTTTTPVCVCPAGTSGIIFVTADPIFMFNVPPASATCGGCPAGLTSNCYPTQTNGNQRNDIAAIDVQCATYTNFCACPSDGTPCFTVGQNNAIFDVQVFSFCDGGGTCLSYLVFFSNDNTDFLSNGVQTVTFVQQTDGGGNLLNFSPTSPYVKAGTIAVSCDGCGPISSNGMNTGTSVTCSGPLTTLGG